MDQDVLGQLFLKHQKSVIKFVHRQYPYIDEETLDQLYSELWFTISKQIRVNHTTIKSLLIKALWNRVKNYLRDSTRSHDILERCQLFSLSDPEIIDKADEYYFATSSYGHMVDAADDESTLRYEAVMSGLPPTLRLVAELYYIDDCTQEEIACHFQTNRAKVLRLINKATKLIKDRYQYYRIARGKNELSAH